MDNRNKHHNSSELQKTVIVTELITTEFGNFLHLFTASSLLICQISWKLSLTQQLFIGQLKKTNNLDNIIMFSVSYRSTFKATVHGQKVPRVFSKTFSCCQFPAQFFSEICFCSNFIRILKIVWNPFATWVLPSIEH